MSNCDFCLVAIKGAIEFNDFGRYFGSTLGLNSWLCEAKLRGLVTGDKFSYPKYQVSEFGKLMYEKLKLSEFPKSGRAYLWE